jgi:pyruvate dehydrogenase E2 component (dihydrolipoamide acetyltransferase)
MSETVVFPRLDQDMQDGTIADWLVEVGDRVEAGEEIAEMETAKVTAAIESPRAGVVLAILVDAGELVDVGAPVAVIGEEGEEVPEGVQPAGEYPTAVGNGRPQAAEAVTVKADAGHGDQPVAQRPLPLPVDRSSWPRPHEQSPRARYDARAAGQSWDEILAGATVEASYAAEVPAPVQQLPPTDRGRRVPLGNVRRATVRTVEASWRIPQFSVGAEVATEPLQVLLAEIRRLAREPRVTLTDMLAAAMARATAAVPSVNAWFEGDAVRLFEEVDLSLMVQTERGLYVPVLRNVQASNISRIAVMRERVVRAAQEGALEQQELEPGTIALSNLGMFEIHRFNAILYPPQVAVLAVGRARASVDGAPMWLNLTVDHRAVDGATAAQYLEAVGRLLADPMRLLI